MNLFFKLLFYFVSMVSLMFFVSNIVTHNVVVLNILSILLGFGFICVLVFDQ